MAIPFFISPTPDDCFLIVVLLVVLRVAAGTVLRIVLLVILAVLAAGVVGLVLLLVILCILVIVILRHLKYLLVDLIVNDIRNFAFALAKASVYGSYKNRKQKFVMAFTIVTEIVLQDSYKNIQFKYSSLVLDFYIK